MWQLSNGSVSAPTMASTATPSCIRWPQRMLGSQYWPRLIDSAPPGHRGVTVAEPDRLRCGDDRLQAAAAQPVEGEGRGLDRKAPVDGGHARAMPRR